MTDTELRRQPAEKIEQGDGQLVLLVDDEYFVRVTGEAILKHLGYRVIVAENGNEAIQLFNERSHEIDLVLMDMIMPEKNGFDAFHEMINIDKQAKIVITSGFSKPERLDELMSAGLAGFISKPFRDIELSRMLGGIFNP